jgi:DNA-binding transcriptional LysR family regulator
VMDRWTEFELFTQIAETRSLSKAADQLNISNATASRYLSSLETRLDSRLVERNTRHVSLTEAGEEFYRRCKDALNEMRDAEASVHTTTRNPRGILRVTSSQFFCMQHIVPILPEFMARYPDIDVQIVAANRYFDFLEHGIDVAIRTKESEPDSSITMRKLARTRRILVAAPEYLRRRGAPPTIEHLAQHKLLLYSYVERPNELHFNRDGQTRIVKVKGALEANDGLVLHRAALAGLGILAQPKYMVYDDLAAGRLVPVLEDWELPELTIAIAYQDRKHLPAKVRVFIDFMVKNFDEMGNERKWTS